jgi:hypothetical protein
MNYHTKVLHFAMRTFRLGFKRLKEEHVRIFLVQRALRLKVKNKIVDSFCLLPLVILKGCLVTKD